MSDLRVGRIVLAATDMPAMAAFYNEVLEAGLQPFSAYGTTLYRGALAGIPFTLCPNEIAGVDARQSRHQFRFAVPDLDAAAQRAVAAGGMLQGEPWEGSGTRVIAIADPDGNTMELESAGPASTP